MELNNDFWAGWFTGAGMAFVLLIVVSLTNCSKTDLINYPKEQKTCVVIYSTPANGEIQECYPMAQTE